MRNYNTTNCNMSNMNRHNCNKMAGTTNYNIPDCNMPVTEERCKMQRQMEGNVYETHPSIFCQNAVIGMAYVPWQKFCGLYEGERALQAGTIFSELEKPFIGKRGMRR